MAAHRLGGCHQQFEQVGFQAHQDGLGFRVAHAAVELQRLDLAVGIDHQAGIQEAGVGDAVLGHAADGRQDHLAHGAGVHVGRHHRSRRIGTHAAGIRALVVVLQALVVLAGGQRHHFGAIAHHHEAGFLALQEFLDHHAGAALVVLHAQRVVHEHEIDRVMGFLQRHGHHHALAGSQTIGLDHDGRADLVDVGMRCRRIAEGIEGCRRDAVALHEGLAEGLGAFQLRSRLRGAENAQAVGTEQVHHAGRQRRLGADHGQLDRLSLGPGTQFLQILDGQVLDLGLTRGAAVAGRHEDLGHALGLRQFPGQGMFTAAAADHQYLHAYSPRSSSAL